MSRAYIMRLLFGLPGVMPATIPTIIIMQFTNITKLLLAPSLQKTYGVVKMHRSGGDAGQAARGA
jgi:hypothetical protein